MLCVVSCRLIAVLLKLRLEANCTEMKYRGASGVALEEAACDEEDDGAAGPFFAGVDEEKDIMGEATAVEAGNGLEPYWRMDI